MASEESVISRAAKVIDLDVCNTENNVEAEQAGLDDSYLFDGILDFNRRERLILHRAQ